MGFSAPLAWLFSSHTDQVTGIYGFQLNDELAGSYDSFIVELNWYFELYEFTLLVNFIKKRNPNAKILFGGLFSSLKYQEIFNTCNVDYFINGDNELPLRLYLDGENPVKIPNIIGRDFQSNNRYMFRYNDFYALEFNLDWFPSYFKYRQETHHADVGSFKLPMLITSKGGCSAVHQGCDYCMGAYRDELEKIYARPPLVMDNDLLIHLIKKIEKNYLNYSIYIISKYNYDFSNDQFQGTPLFEIDSPVTVEQIENIFSAFKECRVLIPAYEEGIMGGNIVDCKEFIELEDEHHRILFSVYQYHYDQFKDVPKKNINFNLDRTFAAYWAHWDAYNQFTIAYKNSKKMYAFFKKKKWPVFIPTMNGIEKSEF